MEKKRKFTPIHRLLHWVIALAMIVLYGTGFLRMYWMNKHKMVDIIASKTQAIPKEEMTEIAKAIRAPMFEWHIIFAYVMVVALLIRMIYMIAKGIKFPNPFNVKLQVKDRLQGSVYLLFYVFVFVSIFTGVVLKQGFLPEMKDPIEAVHKFGIYYFPIFIFLHFIGIAIAEYSNKKGIASKMIGGD